MPKQVRFKWVYDGPNGTATVTDKQTLKSNVYVVADYPEAMQAMFGPFGLSAKLQTANSSIDADGKMAAYRATSDQLSLDKWTAERVSGPRILPPIIEVIMELKKWKVSKAQVAWANQNDEFKAAMLEEHKDRIAEILEERLEGEDGELDDLLS